MASDEWGKDKSLEALRKARNIVRYSEYEQQSGVGGQGDQYYASVSGYEPPPGATNKSPHPIRIGNHTLSRRRLAKLVGTTTSHISMVWSWKRMPSIQLTMKIAEVLGVTLDDVIRSIGK